MNAQGNFKYNLYEDFSKIKFFNILQNFCQYNYQLSCRQTHSEDIHPQKISNSTPRCIIPGLLSPHALSWL